MSLKEDLLLDAEFWSVPLAIRAMDVTRENPILQLPATKADALNDLYDDWQLETEENWSSILDDEAMSNLALLIAETIEE